MNYKKSIFILSLLGLTIPTHSYSAEIFSPDISLNDKEKRTIGMVKDWSSRGTKSSSYMDGGKLVFVHGAPGTPTIIAAPLQVVDVELESGETVNEIVIGDSARWQIDTGSSGNTTHVFIKPVDSGLTTNVVITTDKRVYHFNLISRQEDYHPYVGFVYQTDIQAQLAAAAAAAKKKKTWQTDDNGINLSDLNFGYDIIGDGVTWKPERVYDNGAKMYIQLPSTVLTGEMPALMMRKGAREALVNYRVRGTTFEVDGVFPHLALVVGVGRYQELVEIIRHGSRRNGPYVNPLANEEGGR